MEPQVLCRLVGSVVAGLAVSYFAWVLLSIIASPRVVDPKLGRFEEARRAELRKASWTYRTFEPWIDEIARRLKGRHPALEDKLQQDLLAAETASWRPAEYMAVWQVQAVLAGTAMAVLGWLFAGVIGALLFWAATFYLYRAMAARAIRTRAGRRRRTIKRLLAGAIDLLALMMEVGGGFHEGLIAVAKRSQGTVLGNELSKVLADIEAGRPRKDALQTLADRISDEDVNEVVFAVVQGEELGTPLATILRNQADQMRQKRSQWAEKASGEAQVTIVFPAMVIMLACLIIVAAPFILTAMFSPQGF